MLDTVKLKANGIILHSSLAINVDGVPLGFLDQKLWTRTKPIGLVTKSKKNMTRIPIEEKESFRWIEAIRNVSVLIDPKRLPSAAKKSLDSVVASVITAIEGYAALTSIHAALVGLAPTLA